MVPRKGVGLVTYSPALRALLAAVVAGLMATVWWALIDGIGVQRAFTTPIPYAILLAATILGLPTFLAFRGWLGSRLPRFLIVATLAVTPLVIGAIEYFLYPRSVAVTLMLLSTTWIGTGAFWAIVRSIDFD